MKLSDYVARFLADQGIRHAFVVSGGASLHLIHSVADTPGIDFVCPQHEQAGALAADAYARITGGFGAAIATSGPGATNMLTGVCSAYYDSVPTIFITGQVTTFRLRGETGVRQLGFQETDTVDIFRPVTKYAVRVDRPERIRYELEKAVYQAREGRPGPVLIDIPDDVQRTTIDETALERFDIPPPAPMPGDLRSAVEACVELISRAERPLLIFGWGVRLAGGETAARALVEALDVPYALTWAAMDLLPTADRRCVGAFGTHGTRHGNFAVQNADLIVSIGARLDTREAGSPITTFARGARKVIVDIDASELGKFKTLGLDVDVLLQADARVFLEALAAPAAKLGNRSIDGWHRQIAQWKRDFPICPPEYESEEDVNPYVFVKALASESKEGDVFVSDTGCALAWMMQAFEFKEGQRFLHAFNNTPMGYGLPGAIGACFALDRKQVICVTGDGSLQMNIQEMSTVIRHQLPIKIFLINNHGYSMIQQTQEQWLGGRYLASSIEGGLAFPDWVEVAKAWGYKTVSIESNCDVQRRVREVLEQDGPVFCNVEIRPEHRVIPQVRFGRPIEDSDPLLDREAFLGAMIVPPVEASLRA